VWTDEKVKQYMKDSFVVVSLYVDERIKLPLTQQMQYTTEKNGTKKQIRTVGDKWATFQSENFNAVSQPQYAIISPDERLMNRTKSYTPDPKEFAGWLQCGLTATQKKQLAKQPAGKNNAYDHD
jgi:hypothetical protein